MPATTSKTYVEAMQDIVQQYIDAGQKWPATRTEIAVWAINGRRWEPKRSDVVDQCARDIARAMREEYIRDPQGRLVRAKHARWLVQNGEQKVLWDDIRTAPRDHMEVALQQRRLQIVGDCKQLKTDMDSYNQNSCPHERIQMVFDFTDDLADREHSTEYPPKKPR